MGRKPKTTSSDKNTTVAASTPAPRRGRKPREQSLKAAKPETLQAPERVAPKVPLHLLPSTGERIMARIRKRTRSGGDETPFIMLIDRDTATDDLPLDGSKVLAFGHPMDDRTRTPEMGEVDFSEAMKHSTDGKMDHRPVEQLVKKLHALIPSTAFTPIKRWNGERQKLTYRVDEVTEGSVELNSSEDAAAGAAESEGETEAQAAPKRRGRGSAAGKISAGLNEAAEMAQMGQVDRHITSAMQTQLICKTQNLRNVWTSGQVHCWCYEAPLGTSLRECRSAAYWLPAVNLLHAGDFLFVRTKDGNAIWTVLDIIPEIGAAFEATQTG